jgi:hypothetical protein
MSIIENEKYKKKYIKYKQKYLLLQKQQNEELYGSGNSLLDKARNKIDNMVSKSKDYIKNNFIPEKKQNKENKENKNKEQILTIKTTAEELEELIKYYNSLTMNNIYNIIYDYIEEFKIHKNNCKKECKSSFCTSIKMDSTNEKIKKILERDDYESKVFAKKLEEKELEIQCTQINNLIEKYPPYEWANNCNNILKISSCEKLLKNNKNIEKFIGNLEKLNKDILLLKENIPKIDMDCLNIANKNVDIEKKNFIKIQEKFNNTNIGSFLELLKNKITHFSKVVSRSDDFDKDNNYYQLYLCDFYNEINTYIFLFEDLFEKIQEIKKNFKLLLLPTNNTNNM